MLFSKATYHLIIGTILEVFDIQYVRNSFPLKKHTNLH